MRSFLRIPTMNTLLRPLRLCGLALTLLAMSLPAIPQQAAGRYTVEILVFRIDGDSSGEDGAAAAPLRSSVGEIMPTPVAGRRLAGAASKLRSAGGYRILAHTAWSQTPGRMEFAPRRVDRAARRQHARPHRQCGAGTRPVRAPGHRSESRGWRGAASYWPNCAR